MSSAHASLFALLATLVSSALFAQAPNYHVVKRIDLGSAGDGQEFPNLGCFLDVVPLERLVWTSMLFPGYRPAVFDDIPITAIITMETVGTGTRYIFTALHRDEADFEKNKASGWQEGTEIAVDQFAEHVMAMK
jgi:uncharacterized protein YndB with AHSA1/START domain